ncbi:MAG: carbon-nitrogen family hydrolase [Deltaproteobacteria bacterium]|jgi:predicted amidohydrolase|nr:carbon-nitrogen family hydrolase [Deltaproteobacteria bacterium]
MRIAALQMFSQLGNRTANQRRAAALIEEAMQGAAGLSAHARPDVLVLPEMWDLGYYPSNVLELGDEDGEEARRFLSSLAKAHAVNIVGGSVVRRQTSTGSAGNKGSKESKDGKIWNTTYVFDRQGELVSSYDKAHLFSFAGEEQVFQPGNALAWYELDGVKAASVICYDLRFCELTRGLALGGAQLLFAPAAWAYPRLNHWRLMLLARAVENQFFVIGVNACGQPDKLKFCGHSMLVDPSGEILAEAGDEEAIIVADCELACLPTVRSRINVYRDRRPDLYC